MPKNAVRGVTLLVLAICLIGSVVSRDIEEEKNKKEGEEDKKETNRFGIKTKRGIIEYGGKNVDEALKITNIPLASYSSFNNNAPVSYTIASSGDNTFDNSQRYSSSSPIKSPIIYGQRSTGTNFPQTDENLTKNSISPLTSSSTQILPNFEFSPSLVEGREVKRDESVRSSEPLLSPNRYFLGNEPIPGYFPNFPYSFPVTDTTNANQRIVDNTNPRLVETSPIYDNRNQGITLGFVNTDGTSPRLREERNNDYDIRASYAPRYHPNVFQFGDIITGGNPSPVSGTHDASLTVDFEGNKIPLSALRLQSARDFPKFGENIQTRFPGFEDNNNNNPNSLPNGPSLAPSSIDHRTSSSPVTVSSSFSSSPFRATTDFGFLNNFSKDLVLANPAVSNDKQQQQQQRQRVVDKANLSVTTNPPTRVLLPLRSGNGTPEFPRYKGASIDVHGIGGINSGKSIDSNYEPIGGQAHLHFNPSPTRITSIETITGQQRKRPSFLPNKSSSDIRDDVEVIKRKKQPSPPSRDSDEDEEEDEGYKAIEKEYGGDYRTSTNGNEGEEQRRGGENEQRGKYSTNKLKNNDNEYPFRVYDETFNEKESLIPKSDKSEESEYDEETEASRYNNEYRYRPSSSSKISDGDEDEDEDEDEEEDVDGHSSAHREDYRSPEPRRTKSNREDRNENERDERDERNKEFKDHDYYVEPATFDSYGKDFNHEFEESYKRELPKNEYVHRKEVPEIDEPSSSSSSSSRSNTKDREDNNGRGSRKFTKYENPPKYGHGAVENRGSNHNSYEKSPSVVHEESFGYEKPNEFNDKRSRDRTRKESPKIRDSYRHATRSSYKSPKKDDDSFANGEAYSYSSGSSWKSEKKPSSSAAAASSSSPSSNKNDSYPRESSIVKTRRLPNNGITSSERFNAPIDTKTRFYFAKSEKLVKDITGI